MITYQMKNYLDLHDPVHIIFFYILERTPPISLEILRECTISPPPLASNNKNKRQESIFFWSPWSATVLCRECRQSARHTATLPHVCLPCCLNWQRKACKLATENERSPLFRMTDFFASESFAIVWQGEHTTAQVILLSDRSITTWFRI